MKNKTEAYFLNLIYKEKKGILGFFLCFVLWILSLVYGIIVRIRALLYKTGIFKIRKLNCLVISVGNIVAGGVGKTPAVIMLVKILAQQGNKAAVLTRGYRSTFNKQADKSSQAAGDVFVASDGKEIFSNAFLAGDEPYLLAKNCKNTPVIVGKNRYKSGRYALDKYNLDTFLLDDGYQHLSLYRDLNIALIDCLFPFSNGYLIPRGLLRESPGSLKRADVFFLTRIDQVKEDVVDGIVNKLKKINPSTLIVKTAHKPVELTHLGSKRSENPDFISDREVIAFCSIGNPLSFKKTLEQLGAKVIDFVSFGDHYFYNENDLGKLLKEKKEGALLVTTQKDAVKIEMLDLGKELMDIFVLTIDLDIVEGEEQLTDKIKETYILKQSGING